MWTHTSRTSFNLVEIHWSENPQQALFWSLTAAENLKQYQVQLHFCSETKANSTAKSCTTNLLEWQETKLLQLWIELYAHSMS